MKFSSSKHAQVSLPLTNYKWIIRSAKRGEKVDGLWPRASHPWRSTEITWGPCRNADSMSVGLGWALDFCTNKLPGDANSAGPRATLSNKGHQRCGCQWPNTVKLLKVISDLANKNDSHFKSFKVLIYLSWCAHSFSWVIATLLLCWHLRASKHFVFSGGVTEGKIHGPGPNAKHPVKMFK